MNGGTALEKDRSAVLIPYWFMYFNQILRQQEIITEEEFRKMQIMVRQKTKT